MTSRGKSILRTSSSPQTAAQMLVCGEVQIPLLENGQPHPAAFGSVVAVPGASLKLESSKFIRRDQLRSRFSRSVPRVVVPAAQRRVGERMRAAAHH